MVMTIGGDEEVHFFMPEFILQAFYCGG